MLTGIATQQEPKKSKDGRQSDSDVFTGELELGANWANTQGSGTPTHAASSIELRNEDERLVGVYVLELAVPDEGGVNCADTATYEGTLDLAPDGPGWAGVAQGTWTWTVRPRCSTAPGVYGVNWQVTVLQVGDERLSGDFSNPSDGQGMTMTFEARRG